MHCIGLYKLESSKDVLRSLFSFNIADFQIYIIDLTLTHLYITFDETVILNQKGRDACIVLH